MVRKIIKINEEKCDGCGLCGQACHEGAIAADCAAYACGNFHNKFMKNKITVIGCPKPDGIDYSGKLTDIIAGNNIKSVTAVRMEVPGDTIDFLTAMLYTIRHHALNI